MAGTLSVRHDPKQALEALSINEPVPRLSELAHLFGRVAQGQNEFMIYDDAYRGGTFQDADITGLAVVFAKRLRVEGLHKSDSMMVWSESRPGWSSGAACSIPKGNTLCLI